MKTFRVTLTYDRRRHACPVFEVDVEADVVMEAKAIARRHALKHWSTACPLRVDAVEIAPKMTPERAAQDEAELMNAMKVAS
mgnify:CR=1 FL=1